MSHHRFQITVTEAGVLRATVGARTEEEAEQVYGDLLAANPGAQLKVTDTERPRPDCYPAHCEPGAPCPRHAPAPATVEELVDADQAARTHHALAAMGSDLDTRARGAKNLEIARDRFFELLDQATPETLAGFLAATRARKAPRVEKGQTVIYDGHRGLVKRVADHPDGYQVAQVAPEGQHTGGVWARADQCTPAAS